MKKILVFAAHPDDEMLGCGATLLKFKKKGYKIKSFFFGDGESSRNLKKKSTLSAIEKREKQAIEVSKKSKFEKPVFMRFPDNRLDTVPLLDIVKFIEKQIRFYKPEIIFTHFENDLNIDHQITYKAVMTASRPMSKTFVKKIYSFEIPSSTDFSLSSNSKKIFNPNFFVEVNQTILKKLNLLKIYKNEIKKWPHTRSIKSIKNLAMYRGSQIGKKYAEAFILVRELN
jgi:LmbE family N-acetylglucosaminyl deacetylase